MTYLCMPQCYICCMFPLNCCMPHCYVSHCFKCVNLPMALFVTCNIVARHIMTYHIVANYTGWCKIVNAVLIVTSHTVPLQSMPHRCVSHCCNYTLHLPWSLSLHVTSWNISIFNCAFVWDFFIVILILWRILAVALKEKYKRPI